jgi:hypothetical protein
MYPPAISRPLSPGEISEYIPAMRRGNSSHEKDEDALTNDLDTERLPSEFLSAAIAQRDILLSHAMTVQFFDDKKNLVSDYFLINYK